MAKYGNKVALDQWYTRDDWAQACVDDLLTEIPELKGREFLEPSAGGGAFIRALEARGQTVEGYDLEPRADGIVMADFLTDDIDCAGKVVIGNPPYGVRSALARRFARRAFEQGATHVAFLLLGGFLRVSTIQVGRSISYWKTAGVSFQDIAGEPLPKPNDLIVWLVLSSDDLQEVTEYLESSSVEKADSFWAHGKLLGSKDECLPVHYKKPGGINFVSLTRSDGKRTTGRSFRQLLELPVDRSVLEMLSSQTGNGMMVTAPIANLHLTYPELYRGAIKL